MLRTRVRAGAAAGLALSLLFAILVTAVETADVFVPSWAAVAGRPAPVSIRVPYGRSFVEPSEAMTPESPRPLPEYRHGSVIVPRGTVLDSGNPSHREAMAFDAARHATPPRGSSQSRQSTSSSSSC